MAISTNGVVLTRLAGALYNQQLSNATYNEVLSAFNSPTALNTLANYLVSTDFASRTDLQIATTLVTNLSLTAVTGLDNWIAAQLTAAGTANKGAKIISLLNDFSNISSSDATYGALATAFNTKVDAAQLLSQTTGNTGTTFTAAGTTGNIFTLTTSIDAFTGTANPDTFSASLVFDVDEAVTATSTYTVTDTLNGGVGADVFNITISGLQNAGVTIPSANVSAIETFNVRNTVAQTATLDATTASGLTSFVADRSTGAVAVTGLTSAASAGVNGDGSVSNGASSFGWGATVTAGTVNVSGGTTAGAVTTSGTLLATNTVNSTGAANTIGALSLAAATTSLNINATTNLTTGAVTNSGGGNALATITVTGAGNVSLSSTALEPGVSTINASALTGNLTVALGSLATQTVTGGAGNDVITTGGVLTTGSVNAGAGTADVLVVGANVAHVNTTTLAAKYTNFETMRMSGTLDMALVSGITAVQVTNASTLTNLSATQAANIQIRTNNADGTGDAQSFALASATGTSDALSLTMGTGSTTSSATDLGALTVTGFEILNIATNAGPTSTAGAGGALDRTTTVASLTGSTLREVNLTGTAVNIANIATTVPVTINGSALTGNGLAAASTAGLTVGGSAVAGSTINGSAVRDVFVIAAEGSAYNGNAGNDAITTTTAILVADGSTDGTINGGDGTDTLTVSDTTTTLTDNHFTKLSNMERLALTSTGAADHSVTLGGTFNAAFPTGATITTGTLAAAQDFTFAGGLASVPITLTVDATLLVGTAAETHSLVTGSAADTVTFTGDDTYVGVAGATGTILISTAAGDDTISLTYGSLAANTTSMTATIIGGTGADTITKVGTNGTGATARTQFTMASGSTGLTTTTFDRITGFDAADGTNVSDILEFAGTGAVGTLATSTDFGTILSHSITTGYASFSTAATFATATVINPTNLADVVGYLAANTATADAVGFAFDSNSDGVNDSTLVFTNQASDGLVMLVGITSGTLNATLATVTAGTIAIS